MKKVIFLIKYISHCLRVDSKQCLQSHFGYDLYTKIIKDQNPFYMFRDIEAIRASMSASEKKICVTDMGSGKSGLKKVKHIAKNALKSPVYSQLLFRLVNHFKPLHLLELGTSLGITSLYLAGASPKSKLITLEGCPETSKLAIQNFQTFGAANIELLQGDFRVTLPQALQKMPSLDFVFFDGNHKKAPTLEYFQHCFGFARSNTLFVFDDIHWSNEMEEAWDLIKQHPGVSLTIDLFFLGLVFLRTGREKQNFKLLPLS